jgi:hypothetical protein
VLEEKPRLGRLGNCGGSGRAPVSSADGRIFTKLQSRRLTIIPALGFEIYSPDFPAFHETLVETRTQDAPDPVMCKLAAFQPDAIEERFLAPGRHWACPTGDVVAPAPVMTSFCCSTIIF